MESKRRVSKQPTKALRNNVKNQKTYPSVIDGQICKFLFCKRATKVLSVDNSHRHTLLVHTAAVDFFFASAFCQESIHIDRLLLSIPITSCECLCHHCRIEVCVNQDNPIGRSQSDANPPLKILTRRKKARERCAAFRLTLAIASMNKPTSFTRNQKELNT